MNRIYQGIVSAVEILDGKDERGKPNWKKLENWQSVLWQHHELFQDAVNYYTVCPSRIGGGSYRGHRSGRGCTGLARSSPRKLV